MRVMGLDYGSKTVGVAMSDPLMLTAQPVETITRNEENKLRKTLARIASLVGEHQVERIVLGLPVKMDGCEGERAAKTREFAAMVRQRTGLEPVFVDERLTTAEADEILAETNVLPKDRKKVIDQVAACLILEEYLESLRKSGRETE